MKRTGATFRLDRATVRFRELTALDSVDLEVGAGERFALVGPSGSGKTTLLRLLNGALRLESGTAAVDGELLGRMTRRALRGVRSRIGFVHQDLCLVPNLRVSQNVLTGRIGRQSLASSLKSVLFPARAEIARVYRLLERVGIPEKLYERTDRLSGGQQQRVAVARTLMQEPIAILADEPVSSVDPARARDTVALLADLSESEGFTLVMSLHQIDLAREFFPRLVGMRRGRVVFDRAAADLAEDEFRDLYHLEREELLTDGA